MAPLVLKALGIWWHGGDTGFWVDRPGATPAFCSRCLLSVRPQWPDLMPGVGRHAQLAMGPVGLSLGWCCPPPVIKSPRFITA